MYHDLTAQIPGARERHHESGAKFARRILAKVRSPAGTLQYAPEMIDAIADGILRHRGRGDFLPRTTLQKAFVDADESAADLERIAAMPKNILFDSEFWPVYREYTLEGRPLFGQSNGRFLHDTPTNKEMFRYLVFTLIQRSNPKHYYSQRAKRHVLFEYAHQRRRFEEIMRLFMAQDGLSAEDIDRTWEIMNHQLIQLEAQFRKDHDAMIAVRRWMQLPAVLDESKESVQRLRAELFRRIRALTHELTATRRDAPHDASILAMALPLRLAHTVLLKAERSIYAEYEVGHRLMNAFLQNPHRSLNLLCEGSEVLQAYRQAAVAYDVQRIARDWAASLFSKVIPAPFKPLSKGAKHGAIRLFGIAVADHFLYMTNLRGADVAIADVRHQLNRLIGPLGDEPHVSLPIASARPLRGAP